ncbi:hypothetical protein PYV61_25025, partial [Roseisolibacter sp. H3M3-2]
MPPADPASDLASAPASDPAARARALLDALSATADGVLLVGRDGGCRLATAPARARLGVADGAALEGAARWDAWPAAAREA